MATFLQLALWNANGLHHHTEELKTYLSLRNIEIMLISETHFTDKSHIRIPNYTVYHSNHPNGTAIDGSAIIIKRSIKHHPLNSHTQDFLQATSVSVEDSTSPLTVSAVYLPPKHTVKQVQLAAFYNSLGHWFLAGGNYNTKHTDWDPDLLHLEAMRSSKRWNNYISITSPLENPPTGLPTATNFLIYSTSVSSKVVPTTHP
jgi:hypothetical protein